MQPAVSFGCTDKSSCSEAEKIHSPVATMHDQGKCSALLTRDGFFDFVIFRTDCITPQLVAVVCQHEVKESNGFSNTMSDIKITAVDGFYSLRTYSSCAVGWFMVDNMCINIFQCLNCTIVEDAREQCGKYNSQLAFQILKNVSITSPSGTLDGNTKLSKLSLFWYMFPQVWEIDPLPVRALQKPILKKIMNIAVNNRSSCKFLNVCSDSNVVLSITNEYHSTFQYIKGHPDKDYDSNLLWSLINRPSIKVVEDIHFAMCETSVSSTGILTECSDLYMSCDDGTCVHDSLVCDGHPHCRHGEDETACQYICSDHEHNCMVHCHHTDFCTCSPEYFQCLSGGCVPLQKLCDKTVHCTDASDEPPTCVYRRSEQVGISSLSLDINHYINDLIQQNRDMQHECLQYEARFVHKVDYKLQAHQQIYSRSRPAHDVKLLCSGYYLESYSSGVAHRFSLDRLCVYDHDRDVSYTHHCFNGFHLLKCKDMYCVRRFKCPSSYCISFDHICNKVCDCPHCEDENICTRLLCPGMVLLEQIGGDLRCSADFVTLKHKLNLRQIIHRKNFMLTDDFPVFIQLEGVTNLTHFILTPETVVFCKIIHSKIGTADASVFYKMISVRRLLLPSNNMEVVFDSMFAAMSQLLLLDLSYNIIKYLPKVMLCTLRNLQYLSLKHNLIASLQNDMFIHNPNIQVLLLESNNLKPQRVTIDTSLTSLYWLSSDIPRLCCWFETASFCSPPFPLLVSCSNMITSRLQIAIGWLIGISTSFLNLFCFILLFYECFRTRSQTLCIVVLFSMNLIFAELITSACLFSYSFINVLFQDIFGIMADMWRQSWTCLCLESFFAVSSRATLAFAVCLSLHFALHIPSLTRKHVSRKSSFWRVASTWIIISSMSIVVQILEHVHNIDPYNYFCFPFTTSFPSNVLILSLQVIMLMLDCTLVVVCILSYSFLVVYTTKQRKEKALKLISKRQSKLQKFTIRMAVLILSTVFTWIPILCVQLLVLLQIAILPNIYLWCVLVSFPVNLIIDPILLIRNMLI